MLQETKLVTGQRAGQARGAPSRSNAPSAFAVAGATLGLTLGFVEAALLYNVPRVAGLSKPDVRPAIWAIAPLADAPLCALAGLLLGWIAVVPRRPRPFWQAACATAGLGLAAAYLGWLLGWFRIGAGTIVPGHFSILTPLLYFAAGSAAGAAMLRWRWLWLRPFFAGDRRWNCGLLALSSAIALALLSLALIVVGRRKPQPEPPASATAPAGIPRNNIVLIVLDTVRADHLSCYGYARPTTPNLDRLARQGVLFEDAVAPTSWTLPSLASVLTGLLPHQHGATWGEPMSSQPVTLAEILRAQGYETAAFNSNPDYGLAGWGLGRGFDSYWDAHRWLRHNLAVTFAGQSIYQAAFRELIGFNEFDRRNAEQTNREALRWFDRRSGRPFFLFVNYMDAHRPYLPPAPYDRRFGAISKPVSWRISGPLRDGRWARPVTESQQQQMIDGYDNSLHYLDRQVGRLLDALRASPDAARTFVVVAGDHGEGFGEHGAYDHGWNLYREVLHVPLIVAGPGIPGATRVAGVAELRELFSTVLQLALGDGPQAERASLSRFWAPGTSQQAGAIPVVSELTLPKANARAAAVLSLCSTHWHYLLDSSGRTELFDRQRDVAEKNNLTESAAFEPVAAQLRSQLESVLAHSVLSWPQVSYLTPLDRPGMPFFRLAIEKPGAFPPLGWPVGTAQAFFAGQSPSRVAHPVPSQEELLHTLPYH